MKKTVSICLLIIGLLFFLKGFRPPQYKTSFDVKAFATLPGLKGGRLKPMDSIARNSLLLMRGKQTLMLESGRRKAAIEWLMDVVMNPPVADTYSVFRIDNAELLGLFGIKQEKKKYFSYNDLSPFFTEIERQTQLVHEEAQLRTPYERALLKLRNALISYHRLIHSLYPPDARTTIEKEYAFFENMLPQSLEAFEKQQAGEKYDEEAFQRFMAFSNRYRKLSQNAALRIVPPPNSEGGLEKWEDIGASLMAESLKRQRIDPVVMDYAKLVDAYQAGDPKRFNAVLSNLKSDIGKRFSERGQKRIAFEYYFNSFQPFIGGISIYILVFLVAAVSWLVWSETLSRTAFRLLLLAFLLHTFGLIARMAIQGRPPVTNLYSSAVFIGWASVLLSVFLERLYRNGIGSAVAAMIGFATLVIAHNLHAGGDTFEMMQAVLDDNFWLATHVVMISIGYATTYLAGFLAIIFIARGLLTRGLDEATASGLVRMTYGIVCFALLFSFVGTVLGGIWADQSWGRFWGWDPKENGALMIVLWNAVILHARWGGLVHRKGFMALAVGGNIITSWSWFGTNMLGVGLHSYGFMDKAFLWLMAFILSQFFLLGLCLLPGNYWRSPHALGK